MTIWSLELAYIYLYVVAIVFSFCKEGFNYLETIAYALYLD